AGEAAAEGEVGPQGESPVGEPAPLGVAGGVDEGKVSQVGVGNGEVDRGLPVHGEFGGELPVLGEGGGRLVEFVVAVVVDDRDRVLPVAGADAVPAVEERRDRRSALGVVDGDVGVARGPLRVERSAGVADRSGEGGERREPQRRPSGVGGDDRRPVDGAADRADGRRRGTGEDQEGPGAANDSAVVSEDPGARAAGEQRDGRGAVGVDGFDVTVGVRAATAAYRPAAGGRLAVVVQQVHGVRRGGYPEVFGPGAGQVEIGDGDDRAGNRVTVLHAVRDGGRTDVGVDVEAVVAGGGGEAEGAVRLVDIDWSSFVFAV